MEPNSYIASEIDELPASTRQRPILRSLLTEPPVILMRWQHTKVPNPVVVDQAQERMGVSSSEPEAYTEQSDDNTAIGSVTEDTNDQNNGNIYRGYQSCDSSGCRQAAAGQYNSQGNNVDNRAPEYTTLDCQNASSYRVNTDDVVEANFGCDSYMTENVVLNMDDSLFLQCPTVGAVVQISQSCEGQAPEGTTIHIEDDTREQILMKLLEEGSPDSVDQNRGGAQTAGQDIIAQAYKRGIKATESIRLDTQRNQAIKQYTQESEVPGQDNEATKTIGHEAVTATDRDTIEARFIEQNREEPHTVLDDCTAPYGTDVDEAGSTTYQMQVVNTTGKETMIVVYEDNHECEPTVNTGQHPLDDVSQPQQSPCFSNSYVFSCECGTQFNSKRTLDNHVSKEHQVAPFVCECCEQTFSDLHCFERHKHSHLTEKAFTCEECNAHFTDKSTLNRHKRKHTGEKPFICVHCNKCFARSSCLHQHIRIHTQHRPNVCSFCGKTFIQSAHLQRHLLTHSDVAASKKHVCKECGEEFLSVKKLCRHGRDVHAPSSLACPQCGKVYKNKVSLKNHLRSHKLLKTHECPKCGKKYSWLGNLHAHIRQHEGPPQHKCLVCSRKFSSNTALKCHQRVHKDGERHNCGECNKYFMNVRSLILHQRHHKEQGPVVCVKCDCKFRTSMGLKLHQKVHSNSAPLVCEVCQRKFTTKTSYKIHLKSHTDSRPFKCSVCGKCFTHVNHLTTHTKMHSPLILPCPHCPRTFRHVGRLHIHLKTNCPKRHAANGVMVNKNDAMNTNGCTSTQDV